MKITLNQVLLGIIGILILILVSGTTAGLVNRRNQKPEVLIAQGKAVNLAAPVDTEVSTYYDLGTIRVVTMGTGINTSGGNAVQPSQSDQLDSSTGSPMVITPWIAYPEGDTVFFEELSRKTGIIKGVFSQFFTTHTQKEILSFGEEKIKRYLLEQINEMLSLGQVTDLYFTDFLFL